MITMNLDEFAAEDFKHIQNLRKMGVPEELIQFGYNNTQDKRKNNTNVKQDNNT